VAGLFILFLVALGHLAPSSNAQRGVGTPQGHASPTPTPDDKLKAALRQVREQQERELNEHGPQPSSTSSTGSFSLMSFVRAGWPLVVEYELETGAEAQLEIVTLNDRGFHLFKHRLAGAEIGGGARRDIVTIPGEFGELQPGTIGFSARLKTPDGSRKAEFKLHGLGVGLEKLHARERPAASPQFDMPAFGFLKSSFPLTALPQTGVIQDLDVTPELINTAQGEKAKFRFVPAQNFEQWAADFRTVTHSVQDGMDVTKTKLINTKEFRSALSGGSEAYGDWDGKNFRGKLSKGPHQLAVRAWWSAASAGAGASCFRNADKQIVVE
jgi:hypothetical protein